MLAQYVSAFVLTTVTLLCVAVFVLVKGPSARPTRLFVALNLTVALWCGIEAVAITVTDHEQALLLWRLSHIGVILIPVLFLQFVVATLELRGLTRRLLQVSYGVAIVFQALNWTPWFLADAIPKFALRSYCEPGPFYGPFVMWWGIVVACGWWELFRASRRAAGTRKTQLQYMSLGTVVAVVGGASNFLPTFDIQLIPWNPYGTYGVLIYTVLTGYALVNYRLLQVPVALTRSALLVGMCVVILGLPALLVMTGGPFLRQWLGADWWYAPAVLGVLLTVLSPFLYLPLQQKAEARFLGEQRAYQSTLLRASVGMTRIRDAKKLLRLIVGVVTQTARIRHAALFLRQRRLPHYEQAVARHYRALGRGARLPNEEAVVAWLRRAKAPLVVEELRLPSARGMHDSPRAAEQLAFQLERLEIAVVVPSFIEEELFGFLVLGPKRSGQMYTAADLEVFATLANHAALAIENALSFEELQHAQAQLFQAQKMGTLGQMASGMSHQIHNRLTVLSLAAQNARINVVPKLEHLLRKVVGLPMEIHQAMDELRRLYQVIEDESTRGSQIVRGLLEYSRPSAQQESLTLQPLIEKAIDMLQYKHQLSALQMLQDIPKDLPVFTGSRSQLQDVFFNLLDNACDAIEDKLRQLERETPLTKIPAFQGEIRIRAAVVQQPPCNYVQVTIADNGIGMTNDELSQLFIPFFTTKATSVKGTGMGLFIIHKIVEAHGGKIRASSDTGRGTLFIVELPVVA